MPAYEDPAHWIEREAALPANVDPANSKLSDPEERARMARVFDQGLNAPKGFVLPIQRWNATPQASRPLAQRALEISARQCVFVAGRLADGLAAADLLADAHISAR